VHHFEDAHDTDVTMVKFLKPFPLLLTGDMEGNLFIWMAGGNYQCIMNWINTPGIMQFSQITAIDVYYRENPRKFLLILGDEAGMVRIQNIEAILDKLPFLKPAPPISQRKDKKALALTIDDNVLEALNPTKQDSAGFKGRSGHQPIISESAIKQVCQI